MTLSLSPSSPSRAIQASKPCVGAALSKTPDRFEKAADACGAHRPSTILRLPAVLKRVGLSRSSVYAFIAAGTFPRPIPLGPKAVGWLDQDIDDWLAARVADRGQCTKGGLQ